MKNLTLLSALLIAAAASPALAQAPTLAYSTKGDFAYLDFNPPGGKTPAVKLACFKGSGEVDIADYDGSGADQAIKLTSGADSASLDAKKATGARGDYLKAHLTVADKMAAKFRESGQLEISGQGFSSRIAADAASKRELEQFFIACEEE